MIKKVKVAILILTIISMSFTGCSKKLENTSVKEDPDKKVSQNDSKKVDGENVELKIWSWFSIGEDLLKQFEAENKGIKVNEEIFDFAKCEEEYMKALSSGEGPDILVFDSSFFGQYTVNNVLQDLLEEPFSAGKYKKDFLGWDSGFSVDKKHLLSLTFSTAPYVTLYRADIMKENGFPSEPDEFGKFIEKPENILKIAKKLQKKDKFIFQYPTDLTDIAGAAVGYFDDNLNCIRSGDLFATSLDVGREANKDRLLSNVNFWQESGKKAIKEDRLVMFSLASYVMSILEGYAPEQKGKWRVTKPPLGIVACGSDTRMSINIQSSHKEQAWKLLEYIITQKYKKGYFPNVVSGYIPVHKNPENMNRKEPFFGEQNVYPMLEDLAKNMIQHKLTPMDNKAYEIYIKSVWEATQNDIDTNDAIVKMQKDIEAALAEEKKALRE